MSKIIEELTKEFGKVIKPANSILNIKRDIFSASPRLDIGLGGGIPSGSTVIVSGPPKFGKTTLILSLLAGIQKKCPDRKIWYGDVEKRLKTMNLNGIRGLNPEHPNFNIISSEKGNILSAEQHLSIYEKICLSEEGSVVVVDSSSALCSQAEQINEITSQFRNPGAKLMATFCRKIGNAVAINDIILIVVQHLITDTSGMGHAGKSEDGGTKIQYQEDVKIRGKYTEQWKVGTGENERIIGQKTHWQIMNGALSGSIPNEKVMTYLRYGIGIDSLMEYIEIGQELGIITGKGWYSFNGEKIQGMEGLYQNLSENPEKTELLIKQIKEMTGSN